MASRDEARLTLAPAAPTLDAMGGRGAAPTTGGIMDTGAIIGIALLAYAALCFWVAFAKPAWVWKLGKIEGFVRLLGQTGTVVFIAVFGAAALVAGVVLIVR